MLSLLVSCKVDSIFNQQSEYEKYVEALHTIELAKTALAQDWIKAGQITSKDSLSVSLPYTELTRFDPANPKSVILKYTVKEGQNIQIYLQRISDDSSKVFLNAFAVGEKGVKEVAHEADSDSLKYHVEEDAEHLIRIQPELLRGGLYKIHIGFSATLAFPVPGKTFENISSYYGDARDAGRRKHEGIDIFSPRGTPVVAVMHGFVRRVSNNNLGGKVIFVSGGGYSYYYAHLDSQLVNIGQRVKLGDTLGLVGNTGNAITTAPHLHFGIYSMRKGALNPYPFFASTKIDENIKLSDSTFLGTYHRVKNIKVNLREAPTTKSSILKSLDKNSLMLVDAALNNWYRISLPDGEKAFIYKTLVEKADENSLKSIVLTDSTRLKDTYIQKSGYFSGSLKDTVEVLGDYKNYQLVKFPNGYYAWYKAS